jgi:hypothetical protein
MSTRPSENQAIPVLRLALIAAVMSPLGTRRICERTQLLSSRAGDFVNKILRGIKPADIPVEQPVKFDLMINATTAKVLGLTIPEKILVRASEVY